jgi:hypothetical protein
VKDLMDASVFRMVEPPTSFFLCETY